VPLMRVMTLMVAATLVLAATAAPAQQMRVRATIERVEGSTLFVKTRDGEAQTVKLADNGMVVGLEARTLADIKPGDFVGSAAVPMTGGRLRALEVHIFPESMRGTGEGHRAYDAAPESTMTNATVTEAVARAGGHTLTLKYKDGEKTIMVPAETPIVLYVPGDRSELKPGAKIYIPSATKQPDGTLQTARISVGRNGLTPPM
jgi:hypothetical protein